ncbi:hypothetical protein ACHWQZ_G018181 [Mnemiopsis leidyi]
MLYQRLTLEEVYCKEHVSKDYEKLVLAAKLIGAEVGDQHHSREFPPKVVDAAYSLLTEQLSSYFRTSTLPFTMPFSLVANKDQSHHRKRLLLGMRVLDLTPGSEFIQTIYIAHHASFNQNQL